MPVYECQNNGSAIFAGNIRGGARKYFFMVFIMVAASFKGYILAEKIIVDTAVAAFSV